MLECSVAYIGMLCKGRYHIHVAGRKCMDLVADPHLRATLGHKIYAGKGTVDILKVPVGIMYRIAHIEHKQIGYLHRPKAVFRSSLPVPDTTGPDSGIHRKINIYFPSLQRKRMPHIDFVL